MEGTPPIRILLSSEAKSRNRDRSADILRDSPRRLLDAHRNPRTPRQRQNPCEGDSTTSARARSSTREAREWMAHALVRGTRDYRVELVRDRNRFTGSCECPYYADRAEICKHIWAALLEAERRGLLAGDGPVDAGAILEPEYRPSALSDPGDRACRTRRRGRSRPRPRRRRRGRASSASSSRTSARPNARSRCRASRTARSSTRSTCGETLAGRGTVVNVLFRQRRKNGAWSKPKAVTLTPLEAEHMVDADDREILSLLIGAGHTWTYGGMYDASYQRLSRYVLNGPLEDRVLPMLARSGRGHLDRIGDEHGLFPIGWDDGPAWRFDLEIAVDEKHDGLVLNGAIRPRTASGWRFATRPCCSAAGFCSRGRRWRGWSSTAASPGSRVSEAWVPSRFPGANQARCSKRSRVPGCTRVRCRPSCATRCSTATRDRASASNRPERQNPYALRQDLRATVLFDYDGVTVDAPPGATAYDAERRRLVRRNRAAEQTAIDRLHQLGFRYTWSHFESRQVLGISPDQFPRVVHTLVKEGWRVEAEGRAVPNRRQHAARGVVGHRLVRPARDGRVRRRPVRPVSAAARRHRARRGRRGAGRRERGPAAGGVAAPLRRHRRVRRRSKGMRSGSGRSQAALLDALLAAQPAIAYDEVFERVRSELQTFTGVQALDAAGVVPRARCANTSARRSAGSTSCGGSASAAAWPTTWGSARPSWCWRCSRRGARSRTKGDRRPVARRRAAIAGVQLDGGGGALRAEAEGARPHGTAARPWPASATRTWS